MNSRPVSAKFKDQLSKDKVTYQNSGHFLKNEHNPPPPGNKVIALAELNQMHKKFSWICIHVF